MYRRWTWNAWCALAVVPALDRRAPGTARVIDEQEATPEATAAVRDPRKSSHARRSVATVGPYTGS